MSPPPPDQDNEESLPARDFALQFVLSTASSVCLGHYVQVAVFWSLALWFLKSLRAPWGHFSYLWENRVLYFPC